MSGTPPSGVHVSYRQQYRRCGKAACSFCARGGPGHGPYWYASWWEGGHTRTRYLGKAPPRTARHTEAPTGDAVAPAPAATPRAEPLRVQTLGGFAVWRDGKPVATTSWSRRQPGALFKWLLAAPGHRLARDQVLELLWPTRLSEASAANVRVLIHRLRRVLGETQDIAAGLLRYDGESLILAPGGPDSCWLDAAAFNAAATRALAGREPAPCRVALALYTGDYLPDDPYDEWALGQREVLLQSYLRLLLHAADCCRIAGESEEAIGYLHAALAADRCQEDAALALMRLHAAEGRPGAALRVYRQLDDAMRDELGLRPNSTLQVLAKQLHGQRETAPPPPAQPTNLPAALTSFIGRQREIAILRALLGSDRTPSAEMWPELQAGGCRLLTLVGPGGVGKTRLSLALAEEVLERYAGGIWLADLSSLPPSAETDNPSVARAVATALGVRDEPARPLVASLVGYLKERQLLLLLDNCEHVLPSSAALVATLLAACPALRILATSRETLGVAGEQPWSVPPLSQPEAGAPPERLAGAEAVRLFLARARVQQRDLEITPANAPAIASICRQLDGLPLALELAAARAGTLSVDAIAARLGESLRLLTGGPRTAPGRQRTLRATLDWSYGLLDSREQRFFNRLAVFAGGWTLEAAEAVCSGDDIQPAEVLDLLAGMAQRSLVVVEAQADGTRYRLLETVRHYARELLIATREEAWTQERHLCWNLALAEASEKALRGPEQAVWMERLEREHDNVRGALRWAAATHQRVPGLRIAGAIWRFWFSYGYLREGREWLHCFLHLPNLNADPPAIVLAKAFNAAGALAYYQGDLDQAARWYAESLTRYRDVGDTRGAAAALGNLGLVAKEQGDYARAETLYLESHSLFQELGDLRGMASALNNLGIAAGDLGHYARAEALHRESLALKRSLGDKHGIVTSLNNLGASALDREDYEHARDLQEEGLALARELGNKQSMIVSLANLGQIALGQSEHRAAASRIQEGLGLAQRIGDRRLLAICLEGLASVACALGEAPLAVRLYGAAYALRLLNGVPPAPTTVRGRALYDHDMATLRTALGEAAFAAAWDAGREMSIDDAVNLALSGDEQCSAQLQ
jgi:predicted ATPase/DNA-binding SARP family transcriptional activator